MVAASAIVLALQSIVARNVDPLHPAVVSVTSFRTGSEAFNVIPEHVELRGTARALETAMQDSDRGAHGAPCRGDRRRLRRHRHPRLRAQLSGHREQPRRRPTSPPASPPTSSATARVDADAAPVMGAEDFSFMLNARPGAFIFVGNGDTAKLHHPKYDFNDELIPVGCSYWARLVETAMPLG